MSAKKTPSRPAGKAPPATTAPAKRRRIDWEAVERDYRTGKFTLRELEAKHGASYSEISRHAKRESWQKDLREVIRAATDAALLRDTATEAQNAATDVVLVAAEVAKGVILGQRKRVGRAVDVSMRMLDELDATTTKADQIEALFEVLTDELDERTKASAQQQLREFMRLHARVGSAQKLMDALAKAQAMETAAFNLAAGDPNKPPAAPKSVLELDEDELLAEILSDRAARRAAAA